MPVQSHSRPGGGGHRSPHTPVLPLTGLWPAAPLPFLPLGETGLWEAGAGVGPEGSPSRVCRAAGCSGDPGPVGAALQGLVAPGRGRGAQPSRPLSAGWGACPPPVSPAPVTSVHHGGRGSLARGGRGHGPQSLSEPTAEDPFRFRLVGFGFVSSSSWKRWMGSPVWTAAAPAARAPPLPAPRAWRGPHRGAAGARLLLGVGLRGALPAAGAGHSGLAPALGRLAGRVLILLRQGEEVAEPDRRRGSCGRGASDLRAPSSSRPRVQLALLNPTVLLVLSVRPELAPAPPPSPTTSQGQAQGASLHLVGFVTARLHVLQSLQNWGLAKN